MTVKTSNLVVSALLCVLATTFLAGCEKKNDAVSQAGKTDKINGVAVPGIEETKQIAEEGFLYGLPIVMNYTSMYELSIDHSSSNFKQPIGVIDNVARVSTYKDTARS
jgi:hypothetical protein